MTLEEQITYWKDRMNKFRGTLGYRDAKKHYDKLCLQRHKKSPPPFQN